jgi:hypothetical protein
MRPFVLVRILLMSKSQRLFLGAMFVLCCADFAICIAIAVIVGDVSRGETINGHFYFKKHGELVEVNKSAYRFAQIQMISSFLAWPISFAIWKKLRSDAGRRPDSN